MTGDVYYNSEVEYNRPVFPEQELGMAVVMKAVEDANDGYPTHKRKEARKFLCGYNKAWEDSLYSWCEVANIEATFIIRKSREKWFKDGRYIW
ncbi:MAG: hypothetical protein KBT03_09730 [Bacteroidales bacterium]|nr:hypothetical protein [Candidatus Scybalousia scybalohippi]